MIELAPSLLSANFADLKSDIKILDDSKVKYLHLDVMDGNFVPNISFGPPVIRSIRAITDMIFDVHLMIDEPERYVDDFVKAGADIITFHVEATTHVHRVVQQIKAHGIKAGVALNPSTDLGVLEYIIEDLDLVLIMSVNPGFGGQSYITSMDDKLRELNSIVRKRCLNTIIAVDGGIKTENVKRVLDRGANLIVSGSDVFGAKDIKSRITKYNEIFNEYDHR